MNVTKLLLQQAALNLLVALTMVQPGLAAMLADSSSGEPNLLPQVLAYDPPAPGAPLRAHRRRQPRLSSQLFSFDSGYKFRVDSDRTSDFLAILADFIA
jgi:hypothetical protein